MNQEDGSGNVRLNDRLGVSDPWDKPLTPLERLCMRLVTDSHADEAEAMMLVDALMRGILATDDALTPDAEELKDELFEVVESWLPKSLVIVDA